MREGEASRTALGAAIHRARHQRAEQGFIFKDPLAEPIVDGAGESGGLLDEEEDSVGRRGLRLFIAARARFAEDCVATAVQERAVRQVVVLGAGLETFAYRHPHGPAVATFEVDHPATQAWKRARLTAAGIEVPATATFVSVDFETQRLRDRLEAEGFDFRRPSFFMILGVIGYLSPPAIDGLLATLAGCEACELAWDYSVPPALLGPDQRKLHDALAERTAAMGELYESLFAPDDMSVLLAEAGFAVTEDLDVFDLLARYIGEDVIAPARAAAGGQGSAHVVHAIRRPGAAGPDRPIAS